MAKLHLEISTSRLWLLAKKTSSGEHTAEENQGETASSPAISRTSSKRCSNSIQTKDSPWMNFSLTNGCKDQQPPRLKSDKNSKPEMPRTSTRKKKKDNSPGRTFLKLKDQREQEMEN